MNAVLQPADGATPFDVPCEPTSHFQLSLLGVIAHLIEEVADGDLEAAFTAHPFLQDYCREIVGLAGEDRVSADQWRADLREWEADAPRSLPLCALREAGLAELELELFLAIGLIDEDPRFGALFGTETRTRRPSFALLLAWWRTDADGADRREDARQALMGLVRRGLVKVCDDSLPRSEWTLAVPGPVWDAARGQAPDLPWLRYSPPDALPLLADYLPPDDADPHAALPALLAAAPRQLVVLRGPARNGRKTFAAAIAQALGKGLLVAPDAVAEDEARWRQFILVARLLNAVPTIECEATAGASRTLPAVPFGTSTLFVVTGMTGAVGIADDRPALTVALPLPGAGIRERHWRAALGGEPDAVLGAATRELRLTSGNIRLAARAAASLARLAGRESIEPDDLRRACRTLQSDRLETLASRLDAQGSLDDLAVDETTREELDALVARCRHREALSQSGPAFARGSVGVRALFAGASGTGKTLATRLLAATLGKDLYRVDLAATVNKFIGETEKNLDRAFAAAEELDAILLLDEGDALMTTRTDVSSANDRYANLETNFLLQRIESFTGIVLVTSNAAERIDKAFARRMDVVIHFKPPDEWTRLEILRRHLPGAAISETLMHDIACRCMLSGGQLRNVASHAALLALRRGGAIGDDDVHAALAREYRKTGARCPLSRARTTGTG
jgi:hypothetical protein